MSERANTINGLVIGVVTKNDHPEGKYMVRCKLGWVLDADAGDDGDFLTPWAPVLTQMAGGGRGMYMLPEVGDTVCLGFLHGNIRAPIVVGSLWTNDDKPPHGDDAPKPANDADPMGNAHGMADAATDSSDGKNHARYMISRAGSTMLFDDTPGKEKISFFTAKGSMLNLNDEKDVISVYDHTQEVYLIMDAKNKKITLETKNGDIDVFCKKGTFNVEAKFITTKAEKDQTHEAGSGKWKQKSGGTMDMEAGGTMTEKAPKIDLNP